jgi:hypothetical protein
MPIKYIRPGKAAFQKKSIATSSGVFESRVRVSVGDISGFTRSKTTPLSFQTVDTFRFVVANQGLGVSFAEQTGTRIHKANSQEINTFLKFQRSSTKFASGRDMHRAEA